VIFHNGGDLRPSPWRASSSGRSWKMGAVTIRQWGESIIAEEVYDLGEPRWTLIGGRGPKKKKVVIVEDGTRPRIPSSQKSSSSRAGGERRSRRKSAVPGPPRKPPCCGGKEKAAACPSGRTRPPAPSR